VSVTQDGSPVEFYARLEPRGEPALVHAAVPPGCEILELGCGAGRLTHALVELGHSVVAVDQSREMLAHVRSAERVLADIETLELGRTFDAVLLASHFINIADDDLRRAVLATCRRHVAPGGAVVIQRLDPTAKFEELFEDVRREGSILSATAVYTLDGQTWRQPFSSRVLDEEDAERELALAGLRLERWLDEPWTWLLAREA
jgi:SAM-dependent methyltransferase